MIWFTLIAVGLLAGLITTVAGLGGGLTLTLILATMWSPQRALATTAPALLLGNLHRVWMYRAHLSKSSYALVAGAFPGAFVGGLVALSMPDWLFKTLLVSVASLAVAKHFSLIRFEPGPGALFPAAGLAGFVTATAGGGGLILGPVLLSSGMRAEVFVVSASFCACSMHIARIFAYNTGGLLSQETVAQALCVGGAILAGNLCGKRIRPLLSAKLSLSLSWAVLAGGLILALAQ